MGNFANARWKQWRLENGLCGSSNGLWLANGPPARKSHCRTFYKVKGEGWSFFTFSRDAVRNNTVLATWEALLKRGRSCGVRERAVAVRNSPKLTRSSCQPAQSPVPTTRFGRIHASQLNSFSSYTLSNSM